MSSQLVSPREQVLAIFEIALLPFSPDPLHLNKGSLQKETGLSGKKSQSGGRGWGNHWLITSIIIIIVIQNCRFVSPHISFAFK